MTTFLGIDPGLADTGVAVLEGSGTNIGRYFYGVIKTDAGRSVPDRLGLIFREVVRLLEECRPDAVVVEDVFSLARYPRSGITLGRVTGVVMLAAGLHETEVQEIAVREVKQVLTGNGNAGKKQLEKSVRSRLGRREPITPYHASDALALALIGLYRSGISAAAFAAAKRNSNSL